MNITLEQIQKVVEEGTKKAIDEKLGELYVDRKQHFLDHEWLKGLRKWSDKIQSTALKTVVELIISAFVILVVLGFMVWGRSN